MLQAACPNGKTRSDDIVTTAWLAHCHAALISRMLEVELREECRSLLVPQSPAPHPDELLLAATAYDRDTATVRYPSAMRTDPVTAIRAFIRAVNELLSVFRQPWSQHWQQYWIQEGRTFYSACLALETPRIG